MKSIVIPVLGIFFSLSSNFAFAEEVIGKNLLTCSRSYGSPVKTFTDCAFGPASVSEKSEVTLNYTLKYTYQCKTARLNFGLAFGEGVEQSFVRMENGSTGKEITYEGHGPIATLDNRPTTTFGNLFQGECSVTIDSVSITLPTDSIILFNEYLEIISSLGNLNTQVQSLEKNVQLLATLIAKFDVADVGLIVRNVRDNLKTAIETRESIEDKSDATIETIKQLKLSLLDIETQICANPTLKAANANICTPNVPAPTSESPSIQDILTKIQDESTKLTDDNTDIVAKFVNKAFQMTSLLDGSEKESLRVKVCQKLDALKISSKLCQ